MCEMWLREFHFFYVLSNGLTKSWQDSVLDFLHMFLFTITTKNSTVFTFWNFENSIFRRSCRVSEKCTQLCFEIQSLCKSASRLYTSVCPKIFYVCTIHHGYLNVYTKPKLAQFKEVSLKSWMNFFLSIYLILPAAIGPGYQKQKNVSGE
jgi:hypothetical protein